MEIGLESKQKLPQECIWQTSNLWWLGGFALPVAVWAGRLCQLASYAVEESCPLDGCGL